MCKLVLKIKQMLTGLAIKIADKLEGAKKFSLTVRVYKASVPNWGVPRPWTRDSSRFPSTRVHFYEFGRQRKLLQNACTTSETPIAHSHGYNNILFVGCTYTLRCWYTMCTTRYSHFVTHNSLMLCIGIDIAARFRCSSNIRTRVYNHII